MKNSIAETNNQTDDDSIASKLGLGLITGAADDDPSGIATYSQAGAQFGFNLLWTILLTYPLMRGIQIVSARIGRVSGHGLATNIARHYPKWMLYFIILSLVAANSINIGADIAAMGEAAKMLGGGQAKWYAVGFGVLSILLQVSIPYQRYVRVLKWLTLALLTYVVTVFVVKVPWQGVALRTVFPQDRMESGVHHHDRRAVRRNNQSLPILFGRHLRKSKSCA